MRVESCYPESFGFLCLCYDDDDVDYDHEDGEYDDGDFNVEDDYDEGI